MSGQLLCSKEGADWSFVESPANVNVCCSEDEEEVELMPALAPADAAGLRSTHGTATSFPELEELDVSADEVAEGDDGVVLDDELEAPADELVERTAKSILPDAGFKIMSLIVPTFWPWLLFTSALM